MEQKTSQNNWIFIAGGVLLVLLVFVFGFRERAVAPSEDVAPAVTGDQSATSSSAVSPKPAPSSPSKPSSTVSPSAPAPSPVISGMPVISYSSSGFSPVVLEVERGVSVRFVNKSGGAMRLIANVDGGQNPYPGFDQSKTVGPGGVYEFTFTIPGTWGIKNQFDSKNFFAIVVKP